MARPNEPAQASCADRDGDEIAGLTELVAPFSPTGTREHVLLAKITPNREIDESGTYLLSIIEIETERTIFNGTVRVAVADFN